MKNHVADHFHPKSEQKNLTFCLCVQVLDRHGQSAFLDFAEQFQEARGVLTQGRSFNHGHGRLIAARAIGRPDLQAGEYQRADQRDG